MVDIGIINNIKEIIIWINSKWKELRINYNISFNVFMIISLNIKYRTNN